MNINTKLVNIKNKLLMLINEIEDLQEVLDKEFITTDSKSSKSNHEELDF